MRNFDEFLMGEEIIKNYSQTIFYNQEMQKKHNPYDQELREVTSIENGDIDQLEKSLSEDITAHLGRLAKSDLRNIKNLGIVAVTLASRAAIRGGVLPEIAFTLSDAYIQKIEELTEVDSINRVITQCKYHYAHLAAEAKSENISVKEPVPHSMITRCKIYIMSHLHEKIRIQEIADILQTSPTYLADLFRIHEGRTMTDYILQEKIKLAKNMLIYSPYSYSDIAAYLGFSSQSHLGSRFKKITGYTLRQYREIFGVKEFFSGQS